MADFVVNLSPQLVNMATEGSMDVSLLNGVSIQRTFHGLMVPNSTDVKMVGRLADGAEFDDAIAGIGDLPNIDPA